LGDSNLFYQCLSGDFYNLYDENVAKQCSAVKLSVIARGISVGDELEYTDEVTLGRSILHRIPFEVQ